MGIMVAVIWIHDKDRQWQQVKMAQRKTWLLSAYLQDEAQVSSIEGPLDTRGNEAH